MKNIWEKVLTELRGSVSSDIYATWFKKIAYHQSPEEAEGKLTLTVPSQPHLQYLRKTGQTVFSLLLLKLQDNL